MLNLHVGDKATMFRPIHKRELAGTLCKYKYCNCFKSFAITYPLPQKLVAVDGFIKSRFIYIRERNLSDRHK
jgi:hypothetical protein